MRKYFIILTFGILTVFLVFPSCNFQNKNQEITQAQTRSDQEFTRTMEKHLNAVTNRDIETLSSTMSPNGGMQLILPGSEIIYSLEGFLDYHREWFRDTSWTFETKILNTKIGDRMGMAVTEVVYREPEREGKPYFNRMIVSYDLEKIEGKWYIIKDHASSIEKSTDHE